MSLETKYRIFFSSARLFLFTVVSYLCVSLFYKVLTSGMDTPVPSQPSAIESPGLLPKEKIPPLSHYKTIIKRNLFKTKKGAAKSERTVSFETLDPTSLNLKLWGTIISSGSKSCAVIEESGGRQRKTPQKLFYTGDSVQGATIQKILDEKVILNLDGENEILEMEEFRNQIRRLGRYRAPKRPVAQRKIVLRRSQVDNAMSDLNTLMKQILVSPHRDGIRISRIRPRSIFRKMGIRNGDIITGVDGRRIQSVDSALKIYDELRSSSKVSLQLKRRGREQTINYHIR
ncbi:MAG: type II secretion system protein N [Desulfobacterales bacterium]